MQSTLRKNSIAACCDHHGRQWPLGRVARPSAHRRSSRRSGCGSPRRGSRAGARHRYSDALRLLGGQLAPPHALETGALMALLREFLRNETPRLIDADTRLSIIGRRDRLPNGLAQTIEQAETATAKGHRLHLRIAIDYSSREAILAAAQRFAGCGQFILQLRGIPLRRRARHGRSPDPLRRRAAPDLISSCGRALCRVVVHGADQAGFRRRGFARGHRSLRATRAALRRSGRDRGIAMLKELGHEI